MNSSVTKKCFKSQRPAFAAAGLPTNLIANRATYEFFSALFLLLVESGAKRSMPIEKLGSSSPVFPHFEKKENCTAAKQDGNSEAR